MTVVRWGLLGTAQINRRLIPAIRTNRQSTLVAVASRDAARAETYARQWSIPRAFPDYRSLLESNAVDAVYIGLPNSLHVEAATDALAHGKHVLCEKPLALTPGDVDRLSQAAERARRVVVEGFMYRHEPMTTRVQRLLREGAIGTPRQIAAGFAFEQTRQPDVRLDPALGGGSLWDVGCYAVGYARLLAGREPEHAVGWAQIGPSGVDESFSGMLRFGPELTATVFSSFRTASRTWLEITGQDGVIRVPNPFKPGVREEIEIRRGEVTRKVLVEGSLEPFVREVADFVASVREGRPPVVSLEDSRGNAATLAALHESARTARIVTLAAA